MCFSLLRSQGPGFPDPIVVGTEGSLSCWDSKTMLSRREFVGHLGIVTSVSESPDGRFLASGSTDRTIRIWSLEHFRDLGWPDFEWQGDDAEGDLTSSPAASRSGRGSGWATGSSGWTGSTTPP